MVVKQAVILLLLAVILGLGVNVVSPTRIAYVGEYRSITKGGEPVIPPDADPGDPEFIALDMAIMDHQAGDVIFIDARDPEEFACGTIPGAINIPFDYLPDGDLRPYLDSAMSYPEEGQRIITFCSGEECDLSLHMGRNLQAEGYTNIAIFFGGAREWELAGLEMERREKCDE